MASDAYVLGIDFGTESVRVGIFDLAGQPQVFAAEPYHLYHPRPGWAEQHPDEWWAALVRAVRRALADSGIRGESIIGLSADCTSCTVVLMDGQFKPLRPAILWMDARAAEQARRIAGAGHTALKYNGYGNVSAEWLPCKVLWVKEHEPAIYQQAIYIGEFIDWLTQRLTGEWVASINTTSIRWYYDRAVGGWQPDFYAQIGLDDLLPRLPQRVLDMGVLAGHLRADMAAELGLPPGIAVAEGGADAFVAMIGLNVLAPGKLAFITGSSHLMLGQSDRAFYAKGMFGAYTDAVVPGQYTVEGGQVSTGSVVKWFKEQMCGHEAHLAAQRGSDVYSILNEQAALVPPGAEGLIVLDYWQGNRTPYVDPEARGMIWGLSLKHTNAHIFRAIIEGIAYGSEHIFRTFRANGYAVEQIVAAGGPTKSKLWMQIHADVSNIPITLTQVADAPALGSAILAAVVAGAYPSVAAAAAQMVHVASQILPNQEAHQAYRFYADSYIATYPQMQGLVQAMTRHVAQQ